MTKDLDTFDRRILALLKSDARRTGEQLSDLVGLSPAACLRRVQRLRAEGVILREVAVVAPEYEQRGTTVIILVTVDRHNPQAMDALCHRLRRQPEVVRLHWVTGEDDIVAVLDCASMEDFSDFCAVHFDVAPVVGYKTLVSMREYRTDEVG